MKKILGYTKGEMHYLTNLETIGLSGVGTP